MFSLRKFLPVIILVGLMPLLMAAGPDNTRAFSAAHFVLELDQRDEVGFTRKESKGDAKCQDTSQSNRASGHTNQIDFAFEGDTSTDKELQEWIQASFSNATFTKLEPTGIEYPNLQITLSLDDTQAWQDLYEDFVIRDNCGQDSELSGSITFLGPDMQTELGQITFEDINIVSVDSSDAGANKESVKRVKVELYAEYMDLKFGEGMD